MIRILLVDDHPVVRLGLRALFDQEDDLTVVGEAGTPEEAVAAARELRPDLVLMDLQLGRAGSGADATQAIRSGCAPRRPA
jgi:DNA-binding NarL/FixJ family response regulator